MRPQGRQQRPHGGVGEHQLAFRREEGDGVLQVLHDRLELGRRRRRYRRQRVVAHCGELGAHRLERAAEVGELLSGQIEPDVELTAAQPRQPALNDVDRTEHPLRQQRRDHRRDRQGDERGVAEVRQRLENLVTNEQRGHADANRAERRVTGQDLLAQLVAALLEHEPQLPPPGRLGDVRQVLEPRCRLPFERRLAMGDSVAVRVDDGGVEDGVRIGLGGDRRLQNRAHPVVVADRQVRVGHPRFADDAGGAMQHRLFQRFCARRRFIDAQPGQRRDLDGNHAGNDQHHEGGDPGNLLCFDAQIRRLDASCDYIYVNQCAWGPTPTRSRSATSRLARAAGAAARTTGINQRRPGSA